MNQRPDDPTRQAAEAVEGKIARQLADSLRALGDQASERAIIEAVRMGNVDAVLYRLPLDKLTDDMRVVFETLADLSAEQARRVANEVATELRIRTWFDRLTREFTGSQQAYRDSLVTGVTADVRRTVEAVVRAGIQDGQNPIAIARDVKQLVGLTDRQALAVQNYRRALETGAADALDRDLRDRRSDGPVRRAVQSGSALDQADVDRLVDAYQRKMLQFRSRMISRTEALRAANWGARASYLQMVQRGDFPIEAINRQWLVARDERMCPTCRGIPPMNPKGVGLLEPFQSMVGPVDLPPVHPHCRCTTLVKVDSMMVRLAA